MIKEEELNRGKKGVLASLSPLSQAENFEIGQMSIDLKRSYLFPLFSQAFSKQGSQARAKNAQAHPTRAKITIFIKIKEMGNFTPGFLMPSL